MRLWCKSVFFFFRVESVDVNLRIRIEMMPIVGWNAPTYKVHSQCTLLYDQYTTYLIGESIPDAAVA